MASVFRPDTDPQLNTDYADDFFHQNAPHPPAGAPLLSDDDQQALSTFFKDMGSDNPTAGGLAGNPMHSESWMDLPPKFMGSTSFFGHQHDGLVESLPGDFNQLMNSAPSSFTMPPPPPPVLSTAHDPSRASVPSTSFDPYASMILDDARPPLPQPPPTLSPASTAVHPSAIEHQQQHSQQHHLSAEVLEAASVLQNGSLHRASFSYRHDAAASRDLTTDLAQDAGLASALDMNLGSAASPLQPAVHHTNPFTAMAVLESGGSRGLPSAASMHRSAPRAELRWGSDQNFNHTQYIPQSAKETTEALETIRLESMACLEVSRSASNTRPSSPVYGADVSQLNLKTRTASMTSAVEAAGSKRETLLPPPPPPPPPSQSLPRRKRRKERASERSDNTFGANGTTDDARVDDDDVAVPGDFRIISRSGSRHENGNGIGNGFGNGLGSGIGAAESDHNGIAVSKSGIKRGPASVNGSNGVGSSSHIFPLSPHSPQQIAPSSSSSSGVGDGTAKRRRLGSHSQAKPPRENLSEEQKRENHIKSEQKRRTLIKEGFDDLCVLVPSLHGGGFSKSVMLSMAADWLEALVSGNKQLREQLSS